MKQLISASSAHSKIVTSLAVYSSNVSRGDSNDDPLIVSASQDETIKLWDFNGKLRRVLQDPKESKRMSLPTDKSSNPRILMKVKLNT